jgi:hypothetical protein
MLAATVLMNSAWIGWIGSFGRQLRGEQELSEESPRLLARHHGSELVGIEAWGDDGGPGTLAAGVPVFQMRTQVEAAAGGETLGWGLWASVDADVVNLAVAKG